MSSTTQLNYKELYEQLLKEHEQLQEKHIQYKKDNESRIEELKHLDTNSLFFSLSKEELRECITRLEIKATELYMQGGTANGVYVAAGLTNLPRSRVDNIAPSGSNWSGSIGVG